MPFQVVVVGAGIAGLAAAIALRGEGREVTVLESSRLKSEVGAAIQCVLLVEPARHRVSG
jgi:salicylate hydroxylase